MGTDGNHKLDNQEEVIKNYVQAHPEFQIVKVYRDNGCSGTNYDRASFLMMLNEVKQGALDAIIVKDLSRLGRNHIETEHYVSVIFPFMNVRFIAINDHFDSQTGDCDISVSLKNIINDAYAKDISRKIFSAKQAQRKNGEFVGNLPPYGYKKSTEDLHKLVVDQHPGTVIRHIFCLKAEGWTNAEIARRLNEEGEIAPMTYWYRKGRLHNKKYADRIWEATTIKVILRNQMYAGDMVQGKKQKCLADGRTVAKAQRKVDYDIVPNTHEALVERTLFEKVQNICELELQQNKAKRNINKNLESSENIFKNKIFNEDGQKMYRNRKVCQGNKIVYSYVARKRQKNDGTAPTIDYINEEKVLRSLKEVMYQYIELFFSPEEFCCGAEVKNSRLKERVQEEKQIVMLQRNILKYKECLATLYKNMTEGSVTLIEYQKQKLEYREKKMMAERELDNFLEKRDKLLITTVAQGGCRKEDIHKASSNAGFVDGCFAVKYKKFLESGLLTKELVDMLVKRVTVLEKEKIEVTFLFTDELKEMEKK